MGRPGNKSQAKGAISEELLRGYFLKAGYFVVRGVPFKYRGHFVTDIDLWLYIRASSVSREVAIVDIKTKRTPQAIERIFWTKGLQEAVGVDQAIVATTDVRHEVTSFGRNLEVRVLDGRFLKKLRSLGSLTEDRLTEEEFDDMLKSQTLGKLGGDWRGRILDSKGRLVEKLSFDSINYWLEQSKFFAEQVKLRPAQRELGLRCFYQILAYISIAVDYLLRDLSFEDESEKERLLRDGFMYGGRGLEGTKRTIEASIALLEQFADPGIEASVGQIRAKVESEFAQLPSAILSEYFTKGEVGRGLFDVAKDMEYMAMSRTFADHSVASLGVRALIGCLLDYWGYDRADIALNGSQK